MVEAVTAAALSVLPPSQAPLSAAARAFNLQLSRIDKLKSQLQELDDWGQAHRLALHENVTPLQRRHAQAMREMALHLDQRLGGKALTARQRETARQLLCSLARALAQDGDAAMAALHDRHNPASLAELERERAAALRTQLEAALGETLGAEHDGASADEVLRAGMERLRRAVEDEQAQRRDAADKRKAKKKPQRGASGGPGADGRRRDQFAQAVSPTGQRLASRPRAPTRRPGWPRPR